MKTQFELPLPALLCFVKESCHENLHNTLNELREMAADKNMSGVGPLTGFVKDFIRRLQVHLLAEELDLFPLIEKHRSETNVYPIHYLMDDHAQFDNDLAHIRSMTNNYEVTENFGDKQIYFLRKLIELERIILNHIQIEDHVLYPMVLSTKAI